LSARRGSDLHEIFEAPFDVEERLGAAGELVVVGLDDLEMDLAEAERVEAVGEEQRVGFEDPAAPFAFGRNGSRFHRRGR